MVKEAWLNSKGEGILSRFSHVLQELKNWGGSKLHNFPKQIEKLEGLLRSVQAEPFSEQVVEKRASLEKQLDEVYDAQEAFWYLCSRVSELKDGDRNTKYFHHKASSRKKKNKIKGLMNSNGEWCTEDRHMEHIVESYYRNMFTSNSSGGEASDEILQAVPEVISMEDNHLLTQPFSKDEIFDAINSMKPCKAPGPDGVHAIFYQRFWHIIGDDITTQVSEILHGLVSPPWYK